MFTFRITLFVLILKCLVSFDYTESASVPDKTSAANEGQIVNSTKSNDVTSVNKTQEIATIIDEGGEKFVPVISTTLSSANVKSSTELPHINNNTYTKMPIERGREGELIPVVEKKNNSSNDTKVEDQNVEKKHNGREGEVTAEMKNVTSSNIENKSSTSVSDYVSKPITEKPVTTDSQPTKPSHSRIVPKKGVNFTEIMTSDHMNVTSTLSTEMETPSTTVKTTIQPTTEPKQIRKPTVTTGSEEGGSLVKQKSSNSTPKVPTIEYYQTKNEEENKRSNFIIPIVAVILSVPIVAIILNISYKRCKEWWSHRHYSRMDFLIDGMYNN